jgi:putative membrane protein
MKRALIAVSALGLLAACGQKPEGSEKPPSANPSATLLTPSDETSPTVFVEKAGMSDLFEMEAAKLAESRTKNPEVKAFANMMFQAHGQSSMKMKEAIAAQGLNLAPPAALNPDMQGKLDALKQAGDEDFDEAYMDGQISAHQETLNLMSRYATDGGTGALKEFAISTVGAVQGHLNSAKALEEKLD